MTLGNSDKVFYKRKYKLMLEQHRFELHGSTYTQMFFSSRVPYSPTLVEFGDVEELQIWMAPVPVVPQEALVAFIVLA